MIQARLAEATELAGHPCRLLVFPPGTVGLVDVHPAAESPEALWTRAKSATPSLRALVLTPGCPTIAEHGFDQVHQMVEAAARTVADGDEEIGPIEIAIADVIDYVPTAREMDATVGPWDLETLGGQPMHVAVRSA